MEGGEALVQVSGEAPQGQQPSLKRAYGSYVSAELSRCLHDGEADAFKRRKQHLGGGPARLPACLPGVGPLELLASFRNFSRTCHSNKLSTRNATLNSSTSPIIRHSFARYIG